MGNRKYKEIEIGDKYGNWTVIAEGKTKTSKKGYRRYWTCKCSCEYETIKEVREDGLQNGTSSGCNKCGHKIDLTGKSFGYLTVLGINDEVHTNYNHTFYNVRCKCGNELVVRTDSLTSGSTISCGCKNKEHIDLVGLKFGKLTVLEFANRINYSKIKDYNCAVNLWKCECDCGNIIIVRQGDLLTNHTLSCGCEVRSHGEIKIAKLLNNWNIRYIEQFRFDDCKYKNSLPFDFAIVDKNNIPYLLCEFDGEFHYKPVKIGNITDTEALNNYQQCKIRDEIKNRYCKINKIPLIRINYDDYYDGNLEYILFDQLIKYGAIEELKIAI
jgi:hypothetical protein